VKAVAIHGSRRKCGKTTVAEVLIRGLVAKGYTVASAKDVHVEGFSMDVAGKDSWRHRQAGASTVVLRGPLETTVMVLARPGLQQVAERLDADFLVAEGFSDAPVARIVCAHEPGELAALVDERTIAVSGVVAAQLKEYGGVPAIDALRDPAALVALVEDRASPLSPALVTVNGEPLPMNDFVARIVTDVVEGVLGNLHGAHEGDVVIRIPAAKRRKR
jgi:molybdopterin-guanine dinucleotide biosynthesis protein B